MIRRDGGGFADWSIESALVFDATTTKAALQSSSVSSTGAPAIVDRGVLLATIQPTTCTGSGFSWTRVVSRMNPLRYGFSPSERHLKNNLSIMSNHKVWLL